MVDYLAVLKASYDYTPSSEDEIEIKEDQLLFLLDNSDPDWSKVKLKGQDDDTPEGLVPATYVEPADVISVVKALYDYEAASEGELTVQENDVLNLYDRDGDWYLVKADGEDGKIGYVPGNYVEEVGQEEEESTPAPARPRIVVPDSPPPPASAAYVDPSERVAKTKVEPIETWPVTLVDEKGKKKKGTLGYGNGAMFFASESDKAAVQKWPSSYVTNVTIEKSKHVHIEITKGSTQELLHFISKDAGPSIVKKIKSVLEPSPTIAESSTPRPSTDSRAISSPNSRAIDVAIPEPEVKKNVRWAPSPPAEIPPSPDQEDGVDGDTAVALYDFTAAGDDELSIQEGEQLTVVDKLSSDEWWKCRNRRGEEGVVPAEYVEIQGESSNDRAITSVDEEAAAEEAARAEAEAEEAAARERAREQAERIARLKRERDALEAQKRADAKRKEDEAKKVAAAEAVSQQDKKSHVKKSSSSSHNARRGPAPTGEIRTWHDRTGQFQVDAEFKGFDNGKIRLHKTNGVTIEVPSEKMSHEDMTYVDRVLSKRNADEDDTTPLGVLANKNRNTAGSSSSSSPLPRPPTAPKKRVDWFEFFLAAGCDMDDCTRYTAAFERDKIDEEILPDIKNDTLRSLGLREGDIIRVAKAIEQRGWKSKSINEDPSVQRQIKKDQELAHELQAAEYGVLGGSRTTPSPAPNLFASPGGVLKNNVRRGRPSPNTTRSTSVNVDPAALASATDQLTKSTIPRVSSPLSTSAPLVPVPSSPSPKLPAGDHKFEDDAWAPRPSSTKPIVSVSPPVPPAPTPPVAPAAAASPPVISAPTAPAQSQSPVQPQRPGSAVPQQSTDFELLAKISSMRRPPSAPMPNTMQMPPPSIQPNTFNAGLGVGSNSPMGQYMAAQATGALPVSQFNQPRGPFAPVPSNQALLSPLIPTNTLMNNSFVPTRPNPNMMQQSPSSLQPMLTQPTGFQASQPTGFQPSGQLSNFQPSGQLPNFQVPTSSPGSFIATQPLMSQPTGLMGAFGPSFVNSNPTGLSPGFQPPLPSFNNSLNSNGSFGSPPASLPSSVQHSPANVFASMKAGTFGENNNQQANGDKYAALRGGTAPNLAPQPTGWGMQPQPTGFNPGFAPSPVLQQPGFQQQSFPQQQPGVFQQQLFTGYQR